eukprot:3396338-Rhodomonas_salina.1
MKRCGICGRRAWNGRGRNDEVAPRVEVGLGVPRWEATRQAINSIINIIRASCEKVNETAPVQANNVYFAGVNVFCRVQTRSHETGSNTEYPGIWVFDLETHLGSTKTRWLWATSHAGSGTNGNVQSEC